MTIRRRTIVTAGRRAGIVLLLGCFGNTSPTSRSGPQTAAAVPDALAAETRRLVFASAPSLTSGSVEDQARSFAHTAVMQARTGRAIRLRMFAVGSADLRTAESIVVGAFTAAHVALPVISLIGVAGFPDAAQHLAVETTFEVGRSVNPQGVVLLAGLAAPTGAQTVAGITRVLAAAGASPDDVQRLSCFYESPDQVEGARAATGAAFKHASLTLVRSYAHAAQPLLECEGVARSAAAAAEGLRIITNLPGGPASPNYSLAAIVSTPRLVLTGTQFADDASDPTLNAMYMRLRNSVVRLGGRLADAAMGGNYWVTPNGRDTLRLVRKRFLPGTPPAATGVFFAGLADSGAVAGADFVVALRNTPSDTLTLRAGSGAIDGRYLTSHVADVTQTLRRDAVVQGIQRFTLDKQRNDSAGHASFRLRLRAAGDNTDAYAESETLLDLKSMRTLYRRDQDGTGRVVQSRAYGSSYRGDFRADSTARPTEFEFDADPSAFYAPFVDAVANATALRAGLVLRIPTFRFPPASQQVDWHVFTVIGKDTVRLGDHVASAWVIEEDDWPGFRSRRIWLTREAPFFPRDVTTMLDGSTRTVEQQVHRG